MSTVRYVHSGLEQPVEAIGGSYTLTKEVRLPLDAAPGGEVLYLVGHAILDTTCCGMGGCGFATVLGFVRGWHAGRDAEGRVYSEVEPITDKAVQARLRQVILASEHVTQVDFR